MDIVELRYEALKRYRLAAGTNDGREKARLRAEGDRFAAQADHAAMTSKQTDEYCYRKEAG